MSLPVDGHVHSEWSWDAPRGSMLRTCERAVELGLPALAFTEHLDHTVWSVDVASLDDDDHLLSLMNAEGRVRPPRLDVNGYLEAIEQCRHQFPDLRVLSGLELGEPHWHPAEVAHILATADFDRVLGSLHCLPDGDGFAEPPGLFARRDPDEVVRTYLLEVTRLVETSEVFAVVAHIDYPLRSWPSATAGALALADFEGEFRQALRSIARSGRVLEFNTTTPMDAAILGWWRDEGGQAVTFGSDAHEPHLLARAFREAMPLAEAAGFSPQRDPLEPWTRRPATPSRRS